MHLYQEDYRLLRPEKITVSPRRNRFFMYEGMWYFLSRHDETHGPFDSLIEAKQQLKLFLQARGVNHYIL